MRPCLLLSLALAMTGCGSSWSLQDADGDGFTVADGDCDESAEGAGINPGAAEAWYDGIDGNCDGKDDFDKDGDGFKSAAHGGDDCWDDPDSTDPAWVALNGLAQLTAADVRPDAAEVWYDGLDGDCSGTSDFDQDADGFDSSTYAQADGAFGDDCFDAVDDPFMVSQACSGSGELPDPATVNPSAEDAVYDGVDADCDASDDFDADGDGFAWCDECDDDDSAIYPNEAVPEIWYNGEDENCDGNDADKDGDRYAVAGYPYSFDRNGDGLADFQEGDCWDDPDTTPVDYTAINDAAQPEAADVNPGAAETYYDAVDQDCSALTDDFDQDGDGAATEALRDRAGARGDDCNDLDGSINVSAVETWYDGVDSDCDDHSDYDQDYDSDDSDDYGGGDCNDSRAAQNSLVALEDCTTTYDDDCDGDTNDPDDVGTTDSEFYYYDADRDGYGTTASRRQCQGDSSSRYDATVGTDCDDASSSDYPGATETVGNSDDEDCNGTELCYDDDDNDGQLDTSGDTRVSSSDTDCNDANEGTNTDATTDCDDADANDYLGATETVGNGDDESCDGTELCYDDDDNDGQLDTSGDTRVSSSDTDCNDANEGTNADATTDCDDSDSGDYLGATETIGNSDDESCDGTELCYDDDDNDGYLDTTADTRVSSSDTDCADANEGTNTDPTTDCDDADASDNPGATEIVGNSDDDNCDGSETCYDDDDNDGYLDTTADTRASIDTDCNDTNEGTSSDATTDCDDSDSGDYPGATETIGNGDDENCDGAEVCYVNADGDGYRLTSTVTSSDTDCSDSGEALSSVTSGDCDDTDSGDYPGATETPGNGDDESCDGTEVCYVNADGDTYRLTSTVTSSDTDCSDAGEALSSVTSGDCDDTDSGDYPGATETIGNGDDENCDGAESCYTNADGDAYRSSSSTVSSTDTDCSDSGEALSSVTSGDCNDASALAYPGATEICDGIQNNCSATWSSDDGVVHRRVGSTYTSVSVSTTSTSTTSIAVSSGSPEYLFCDGDYYVQFDITGSAAVTVKSLDGPDFTTLATGSDFTGAVFDIRKDTSSTTSLTIGSSGGSDGLTLADGEGEIVGTTLRYGGMLYGDGAVISVYGSYFIDGAVTGDGGAVGIFGASTVNIYDSFIGLDGFPNTANNGGGIYVQGTGTTTLDNTVVAFNEATNHGGGATVRDTATLVCIGDATATDYGFTSNTSANEAGGVWVKGANGGSTPTFTATSCDFGTSAAGNDNDAVSGIDIVTAENATTNTYGSYGNDATFSCNDTSCTP